MCGAAEFCRSANFVYALLMPIISANDIYEPLFYKTLIFKMINSIIKYPIYTYLEIDKN